MNRHKKVLLRRSSSPEVFPLTTCCYFCTSHTDKTIIFLVVNIRYLMTEIQNLVQDSGRTVTWGQSRRESLVPENIWKQTAPMTQFVHGLLLKCCKECHGCCWLNSGGDIGGKWPAARWTVAAELTLSEEEAGWLHPHAGATAVWFSGYRLGWLFPASTLSLEKCFPSTSGLEKCSESQDFRGNMVKLDLVMYPGQNIAVKAR